MEVVGAAPRRRAFTDARGLPGVEIIRSEPAWPRLPGITIGIAAQLAFAATVVRLFLFLGGNYPLVFGHGLWLNALLALQFGVIHSLLLHAAMRGRLQRHVPRALYGSLFCLVTCASLSLVMEFWVVHPLVIYQLSGPAESSVRLAYHAAWLALIYSLILSGIGYQTGFTTWWHWLRGTRPPPRTFIERQAYRYFRHPIYLSFLGLIWFQPRMTLDHLVLSGIWTGYILVGSYLKDERVAHYVGEPYRDYQRRVSGFPFVAAGADGRRCAEFGDVLDAGIGEGENRVTPREASCSVNGPTIAESVDSAAQRAA